MSQRLSTLTPPGNLFATEEWLSTWWKHFGQGRPRSGDGLLYEWKRFPFRVLRLVGAGSSDIAAVDPEGLGDLLARERWDVFLGESLPAGAVAGRVLRRTSSPVLRFEGDWDAYLASRSSNFRAHVRRRERRLAERALSYRLTEDPGTLDADLHALFALHSARWGASSPFAANSTVRAFHREFAALALERGWLRLWLLEVEDKAVAAWYGFRFKEAEYFYQAGRDPAFDALHVGFVLMAHTVREALEDGVYEYRLLRGGDSYKERFANGDAPVETVVLARGRLARAAVSGVAVLRRLGAGR
jgi:CelD/BcsL family acetyltransferase involved in cellulose biosynthesis